MNTTDTIQETWDAYGRAWADVSAAEREHLLRQTVTEDCDFASPAAEAHGRQELASIIEAFQTQSPGASITTHTLIVHHHQLLAAWTIYSKEGAVILSGHSSARYDAEGRLTHLAGFWTT